MSLGKCRLDRFIAQYCQVSRRDVRLMLAQGRVLVNNITARDIDQIIDSFSTIVLDGEVIQANAAHYIMLHKPIGVVSATKDDQHKTVIDLLDYSFKSQLHIVGRLDLNTSGLLLLTNDSRWSERLTQPESKVSKHYVVTLKNKITKDYIDAFANGMYFGYENLTTKPAKLTILSDYQAEVELSEGRYHQIKRMFGRFRNPVVALHRGKIGNLLLDPALPAAGYRKLTADEMTHI